MCSNITPGYYVEDVGNPSVCLFKKKRGSMSIQVEVLEASAVSTSANNEQYKSRINSMEVFENDFLPENRFQRPHGTL